MDIAALTALALTAITTFLSGAADGAAHKAGEAVYDQGKHLYEIIRARFSKEADGGKASQALTTLASDPDYRPVVEQKLARILSADPAFEQALRAIIESGPRITLTVEEDAIAWDIRQSISGGSGVETIDLKKGARGCHISQEIK